MGKKTIVLGVIGADCHAVGNKILDYSLTEAGFHVVNIGVLSPQEDFINAAIETGAEVIMVSSETNPLSKKNELFRKFIPDFFRHRDR